MKTDVVLFSTPKDGNTAEEYEDAYWPVEPFADDRESFSFAIADGASETSYAKDWAKLIVKAFCVGELTLQNSEESISKLREEWRDSFAGLNLPWYAEEKIRLGAFSSLLGFTLRECEEPGRGEWEAIAIGDSCLFHVREGELIRSFPLEQSKQFNNRPYLLSSISNPEDSLKFEFVSDSWLAGDSFYLMTDALACWFLEEVERQNKPWMMKRRNPKDIENQIKTLRKRNKLRNDDVTYIRIEPY